MDANVGKWTASSIQYMSPATIAKKIATFAATTGHRHFELLIPLILAAPLGAMRSESGTQDSHTHPTRRWKTAA
jgi:hypothetical protein